MNELLAQLWTPEIQATLTITLVMLIVLYVLCIVWVVRDAYARGAVWYVWAIVSLVPIIGVVAYLLLRPPLMQIDHDEQELEVALKQRELMKYGECSKCGYPVESDYIVCPNCHQRLKNICPSCGRALDPAWSICPYCATPAPGARRRQQPTSRRQRPEAPEQRSQVGRVTERPAQAQQSTTNTTKPQDAAPSTQA